MYGGKYFQRSVIIIVFLLNLFCSCKYSGMNTYANSDHQREDAEVLNYDITVTINSNNSATYTVNNKILIKAKSAADFSTQALT